MSELGEGAPKNPITDNIQAAKKALETDGDYAGEALRSLSDELASRIETSTSANDPLAYSLRRVVTDGRKNQLIYLLEPSANSEGGKKIKMVYVLQDAYPGSNTVSLLDNSSERDPYDKFLGRALRHIGSIYGKENQVAFLDDIAQVYSDISSHGIQIDPTNVFAVHLGPPLAPKFEEHIKELPFTRKLKFSSETAGEPTPRENYQAPPATMESTDSLRKKAEDAKKAALTERIQEGDSRRVEDLERIAEKLATEVLEREIADQEEKARPKIDEYLSRPGVKEVLRRFSDKFNHEPGTQFIYGITEDGLVVAVRAGCSQTADNYFKAWVLDVKLPPEEMEKNMLSAGINRINVGRLHKNSVFPRNTDITSLLSDEQIGQRIFPPNDTQVAEFYKKTGGFAITHTSIYSDAKPIFSIGGGRTLYPLNLE